jgi:hypothetical protein
MLKKKNMPLNLKKQGRASGNRGDGTIAELSQKYGIDLSPKLAPLMQH